MSVEWRTLPNGQVEIAGEGVTMPAPAYEARLRRVVDKWGELAREHARRTGVPFAWVVSFISVESGGDPKAVSPAGAVGLMQLMPVWWHGRTQAQMLEPGTNVSEGTDLLKILRAAPGTGGELPKVASAYNCGSGSGSTPWARPGTRWGMCEAPGYIDEIVREANFAAVTWPEGSTTDLGSAAAFLLKLWGVLKLAGVRLPW